MSWNNCSLIFKMPLINNAEVIKRLIDEAKINTSVDTTPTQLAEKIIAVLNVNPEKQIRALQGFTSDSTSADIFTTSTTKRTFLVGIQMSISKDAVSDAVYGRALITPKGKGSTAIMYIRLEPTTAAQALNSSISMPPLELEKGSSVNIGASTVTASIDINTIILYYEVEP